MMKLGRWVRALYKNLTRVRIWGSKVKVTRDKETKKCGMAFFSESVLAGASCVVRQFYAGGKISTCCLVTIMAQPPLNRL